MHYIIVPQPIELKDFKTGAPVLNEKQEPRRMTLFDVICDVAFADRRQFGDGWKAGVALKAIHDKFSVAKPGDVVSLEDDHYERLNSSILCLTADTEKDSGIRYDPKVLFQVLPHLRAVKEAMTDEQYREFVNNQLKELELRKTEI